MEAPTHDGTPKAQRTASGTPVAAPDKVELLVEAEAEAATAAMAVSLVNDVEDGRSALEKEAEDKEIEYAKTQKRMLYALCFLNIWVNFDGGALPATLSEVKAEFNLTYSEAGALGGLVFFGVTVFSPFAGYLLTTMQSQRKVVLGSIACNTAAVAWFAASNSRMNLFGSRFMMGVTQCSIIVYSPVWVDEFAPPESATLWMALMQASVAVGIMLGYITGGVLVQTLGAQYWRLAIGVQAGVLALFVPLYCIVDGKHVNAVGGRRERVKKIMVKMGHEHDLAEKAAHEAAGEKVEEKAGDGTESPRASHAGDLPFSGQMKLLVCNGLYVVLTIGLSGLYFVVTGIQFWVTDYLTEPAANGGLGASKNLVIAAFSLTSITAPTAGVIFGGWWVDRHGGYKDADGSGAAVANTLKSCMQFGLGALCGALPAAFVKDFWVVIGGIWIVLFFGGAMLPPATGVCVNAVDPHLRSLSSAFSMFCYNALGYSAAPYICGVIAEKVGLLWGFRTIMLTTCLALITIAGALCIARREVAKFKADAAAAAAGGATEGEVLPLASSGAAPAAEDTVAPNAEPAKKTAHPSVPGKSTSSSVILAMGVIGSQPKTVCAFSRPKHASLAVNSGLNKLGISTAPESPGTPTDGAPGTLAPGAEPTIVKPSRLGRSDSIQLMSAAMFQPPSTDVVSAGTPDNPKPDTIEPITEE